MSKPLDLAPIKARLEDGLRLEADEAYWEDYGIDLWAQMVAALIAEVERLHVVSKTLAEWLAGETTTEADWHHHLEAAERLSR